MTSGTALLPASPQTSGPARPAARAETKPLGAIALLILCAGHVGLAFVFERFSIAATAHALVVFLAGLWLAIEDRQPQRILYLCGYVVGAELLWRVTQAGVFWEYSKYLVILFGWITVLRYGLLNRGRQVYLLFLVLLLPALAVLHFTALAAFAAAHRRLRPGRNGALFEALVAAACYPPLLLRAHSTLHTQELGSFHPAVVAAAVLPEADRRAFLRAEWVRASARTDAASQQSDSPGLDELERRALARLAGELGESPETWMAPPPRQDPSVEAYCPACLSEYRSDAEWCTECGIALIPYGARDRI